MIKNVFWAIVVLGGLLGVVIGISGTNYQEPIKPLAPVVTTTPFTPPTAPPFPTNPSPTGDCWNDAAGPGCATTVTPTPTTTQVPTPTCGMTIGCQETVPGVPQVPPGGTIPTPTSTPFPYQQYFCDHMQPKPPGCSEPATTPLPHTGIQVVSFKQDPMWTCDPLIPTYDPRWCYADQQLHQSDPTRVPIPPGNPFSPGR